MILTKYFGVPNFLILIAVFVFVSCSGCSNGRTNNLDVASTRIVSKADKASNETEHATTIRFEEVARDWGLEFTYHNDEQQGRFAIIESMGGGVGLLDFDRDGWLDVWLPGGGRYAGPQELGGNPTGLFRADVGGCHYLNIAESANAASSRRFSYGVAVSDIDHDGFDDVLMTGYGGVQYFRNQGDGTFWESASVAGLNDPLWSVSAAWGDLNGDQHPDLYITHYVNWSFDNDPVCAARPPEVRDLCPPRRFDPLPDTLYFSNGDGTFRDVTAQSGLRSDGKGLGVVLTDFDDDGDLDIYVANDTDINFLYRNDGGQFTDLSIASGTGLNERGLPDGSMGTSIIDFDNNGLPDILVTNYEGEDAALYQNLGNLTFRHVSRGQGMSAVGKMYVGWGMAVLDADLDGDEDVVISNGHAIRFPGEAGLAQRPIVYENRANRMVNVADSAGEYFLERHRGRGLASGDLDRDGRMDVVGTAVNETVSVLRNSSNVLGTAVRVRLVGRISPRDAIGASVTWQDGPNRQVRAIVGGGSYASASERTLSFTRKTPSSGGQLEIRWPSGHRQTQKLGPDVHEITIVESTPAG